MTSLPLLEGAKIGIIGGGPAGSLFAHFILKEAQRQGLHLQVFIYDKKPFSIPGPRGCNMCAGAIGAHLVELLRQEGFTLPQEVMRSSVVGYTFHTRDNWVNLDPPSASHIYTVFRGGGPWHSHLGAVSFDQYLLDWAVEAGAIHRPIGVENILLSEQPAEKAVLRLQPSKPFHGQTGPLNGAQEEEVDLVVGAFGVNSHLGSKLFATGYRPPQIWQACEAEIEVDERFIKERYAQRIHLFTFGEPEVKFMALIPKGNFITASAVGPHVRIRDLKAVLQRPEVAPYLPSDWQESCHCHPKFPVSGCHPPTAHRLVIVGDACKARYLKNGIESTFYTALLAANTAIHYGVSAEAFINHYYPACQRMFHYDNQYGKLLFKINDFISRHPILYITHLQVAQREQARPLGQEGGPSDSPATAYQQRRPLSYILWNMFTGEAPYKKVLLSSLGPRLQARLFWQTMRIVYRWMIQRFNSHRKSSLHALVLSAMKQAFEEFWF